jgi:hypothetical protein
MGRHRTLFISGLFLLVLAFVGTGLGAMAGGGSVHAAPAVRPAMQGVQASGLVALGGGTCFPDAVLTDCAGTVTHQLKGPGGVGFFTPYLGKWVDLTGAEQTCPAGDKYLDVVTMQVSTSPCGTPTPTFTPGGPTATPVTPTATPGGPTETPTPVGPTPTPPAGGNLALGKLVQASTFQPPQPPQAAVDGDPNTFWASNTGFDPNAPARNVQWIYIDLGTSYTVQTMHMLWSPMRYARNYAIYAYQDWCGGWCIYASTRYGDGDDTAIFPEPIEARYFMLWLVNPYLMGSQYELREWEIGGGGAGPSTAPNLAAGKPAVALNTLPGFDAPRSTDADLATDWQSLNLPVWIYVDLVNTYDINRAILRWTPGMHATTYALYAWNGWTWVAVYSFNRGVGGDETAIFPTVRTRWLLLYAIAGPAGKVGLREFEVYERTSTTPPHPLSVSSDFQTFSNAQRPSVEPGKRWPAPQGEVR